MTSNEKSFYEPFIVALTRRDLLDLSVIDSRVKPSHFQWGGRAEKHNRSDVLLQTHEILWIFSWPFCWVKSWNVRGEPDPTSWLTSSQLQWTQRIWTLVLVYRERARCTVRIQEPYWHCPRLYPEWCRMKPLLQYPWRCFKIVLFWNVSFGFCVSATCSSCPQVWSQISRRGERRNALCCSSFSKDTHRLLQWPLLTDHTKADKAQIDGASNKALLVSPEHHVTHRSGVPPRSTCRVL